MGITIHGLEAMGFRPLDPGQQFKGTFTRVDVFAIQGLTFDASCLSPITESVNGVRFRLGFGSNVNAICRSLVDDDYVDDEEQWKKDTQSTPPYMLLSFGPTDEYVGSGVHFKEDGEHLLTYDSFSEARRELRRQFDAVSPSLITCLSHTFSNERNLVRFIPRDSAFVGRLIDGRIIRDIRFEIKATAYVSTSINEHEIQKKISLSLEHAKVLDSKIAGFYVLASNENDPLKRFLYFFLFIERLVHSTFSTIDHPAVVLSLLSSHRHVETYGPELLTGQQKNLRERFIWCVMHQWTHMTDSDIEKFVRLKKIRDKISHGELTVPDAAAVPEIEALANRIQGSSQAC